MFYFYLMLVIKFSLEDEYNIDFNTTDLGEVSIVVIWIKEFIIERLSVLNEEIEKEPNGYVWVDIGKPEIRYYFSEPLAKKMLDSISEADYRYITTKIYYYLNRQ